MPRPRVALFLPLVLAIFAVASAQSSDIPGETTTRPAQPDLESPATGDPPADLSRPPVEGPPAQGVEPPGEPIIDPANPLAWAILLALVGLIALLSWWILALRRRAARVGGPGNRRRAL